MRKIIYTLIGLLAFVSINAQNAFTPSEFLDYELGSRFTFHADIERYCDYLVNSNPHQFKKINYGKTEEGRNLFVIIHTNESNLKKLESLRENHLNNIEIYKGEKSTEDVLITWYSFNIHGDEASSSEAALKYMHYLASRNTSPSEIIIVDPCLNPDGREHYVQWYSSVHHNHSLYNEKATEHQKPWPQGRYNHYLSDLNRDWVWQVQKESKQRLALYNSWMPHLHADFHEMEPNKSYFFPPAAEPLHEAVEPYQKEILETIGKDLEQGFENQKWDYFSKKEFDLLYPSYADTYATFNGAIGLTLEQGGGEAAGLMYIQNNGDTLTLTKRIDKHFYTAKSLYETAFRNKTHIISSFQNFHSYTKKKGNGFYKNFVIKNTPKAKTPALIQLLDNNGITYHYAHESKVLEGYNFHLNRLDSFMVNRNDLIISTFQPKGRLVRVLFEPETAMNATKTYDISSWAIPYLHHIKAYAVSDSFTINKGLHLLQMENEVVELDYLAFSITLNSAASTAFLSEALQMKAIINVDEGVLVINKNSNKDIFESLLERAKSYKLDIQNLRKADLKLLKKKNLSFLSKPKVAVLVGPGVFEEELGDLLFYLDKHLSFPFSEISTQGFENITLSDFDVLIVSNGNYNRLKMDEERFKRWLAEGGKLILLEGGITISELLDIGKLAEINTDEIKYSTDKNKPFNLIQGAMFNTEIDNASSLRFGLEDGLNFNLTGIPKYALKNSKTYLPSTINADDHLSGFVGKNARTFLNDSFILGTYFFGNGVVHQFAINPLFRGIMEDGKILMGNAIFLSKPAKPLTE
ncbi:M14 family zinc carboxypeptidase [uncultured Arcticibacterium sp.]|uniref:M14 family zinc carboxypeptidase n=1 Tax=uncultured Arcticibacterium sp. TaxID=2173042 RepID=UPI0030F79612